MFRSEIRIVDKGKIDRHKGSGVASHAVPVSLLEIRAGQWARIASVPHRGTLRSQFIRVGIHEGEKIRCLERLPGGTIVIGKNRQQIAIGHQLAREITVTLITAEEKA